MAKPPAPARSTLANLEGPLAEGQGHKGKAGDERGPETMCPLRELRGQNMAVLPTDGIRADWRGGQRAWQASSNVFQVGRLSFG